MRILLLENDRETQNYLTDSFREAGFSVDCARNAWTALSLAAEKNYDALVVDLDLPDQRGFEVILELRRGGIVSPVVILSSSQSVDHRVKGLEVGGGDFVTKPFAIVELIARVRNLVQRPSTERSDSPHLKIVDLQMDLMHRKATLRGKLLNLSPQEFSLLEYLGRHAGRVVTRAMLMSDVWDMPIQPDTNVIDVHIYRLRGKLDGDGREPLIQTVRGIGYLLRDK